MGSDPLGKDDWQEILNKALGGDSEALGILCQNYLKPKVYAVFMNLSHQTQSRECWKQSSSFDYC